MLVADDDDDVLEYADSQARAAAANLPKTDESETPGEPELDGELNESHFQVLPLVLELLEAHAVAGSDGLTAQMDAIRQRLTRCERLLSDTEPACIASAVLAESRAVERLQARERLLQEHKRKRLPPPGVGTDG